VTDAGGIQRLLASAPGRGRGAGMSCVAMSCRAWAIPGGAGGGGETVDGRWLPVRHSLHRTAKGRA
jgi:hypothetical protein